MPVLRVTLDGYRILGSKIFCFPHWPPWLLTGTHKHPRHHFSVGKEPLFYFCSQLFSFAFSSQCSQRLAEITSHLSLGPCLLPGVSCHYSAEVFPAPGTLLSPGKGC